MSLAMITRVEYKGFTYEIQQVVPDGVEPSDDWHRARRKRTIEFIKNTSIDGNWSLLDQAQILVEMIQSEFGGLPSLVRVIKNPLSEFAEGALAVLSPELEPDIDMTGVDPVRGDEAHRWSHLMKGQ